MSRRMGEKKDNFQFARVMSKEKKVSKVIKQTIRKGGQEQKKKKYPNKQSPQIVPAYCVINFQKGSWPELYYFRAHEFKIDNNFKKK